MTAVGAPSYEELTHRLAEAEKQLAALRRVNSASDQALRRARTTFSTIYHAAPLVMTISSIDEGLYYDVNEAFERVTGYTREETIGTKAVDLGIITAVDRKRIRTAIERDGRAEGLEIRLTRADGSPLITLYHGEIIETEEGPRLLSITTDITERSFAKRALQESEERFRLVIENLSGGVFLHDMDGRLLMVNAKACMYTGYRRDELLSMRVADIDPGSVDRNDRELVWRRLSRGDTAAIRGRHLRKDGTQYPVEVHLTALTLDRRPVLLGEAFDITDREEADRALKESEREKSLLLNTTAELCAYYDLDLTIRWANRAAAESVGLDPGELEGMHCYELWNDLDEPCEGCPVVHARDSGRPETGERVTPDGRRWRIRGYPVFDGSGEVTGLIEYGQDITEQWNMEAALKESEAKFRAIVNHIDVGIAMVDADLRVIEMNRCLRAWFPDVDPEEEPFCYRAFPKPPLEEPVAECPAKLAFEDGRIHSLEVRIPMIDGEHTFKVVASPLVEESGNVSAVVEMIDDTTEELLFERKLRESQRMEAVGQLTGGVAHDFNNLLQVINGETALALDTLPPDHPAYSGLTSVTEAGDRAAQLVSQLLLFSRRQVMRPVELSLNEVAGGVVRMLRRVIGERIEVRWKPSRRIKSIRADRGMIEQLCMNLCLNARDAMPDGGVLLLESGIEELGSEYCADHDGIRPGSYVFLRVVDNGCGMDEETLAHVFEPFFTTKEMGKGTGLGLSTVYGIVKQHGGAVDIVSAPHEGTRVEVFFPLERSDMWVDGDG